MLRKLIMLAVTTGLAKKVYDNYRRNDSQKRSPFPTAKEHPGASSAGRTRRGRNAA
jgi:hypothetical protein